MSRHMDKALIVVFFTVIFAMFVCFLYSFFSADKQEHLDFQSSVSLSAAKRLPFYTAAVGVSKRLEALLGWRGVRLYSDSGVIQISDGHYTNVNRKIDMARHVAAVTALNDYALECGIPFLYVQAPAKICRTDPESGTLDFSVQNADAMMDGLRKNRVDVLDLQAEMDKIDPSTQYHHSLYYRTDHHWRIETALWAAGVISYYCNAHYGSEIDLSVFDPTQYTSTLYEDIFLGAHGASLTTALVQPEDFSIVRPKFETFVGFSFPKIDYYATGDDSVLFNMEPLHTYAYDIYLCGTQPLKTVTNFYTDNVFRVLFVNDSYNVSCGYFFSFGVMENVLFDPRYSDDSLHELIDQEWPDAIIMLCYSGNLIPMDGSTRDLFNLN